MFNGCSSVLSFDDFVVVVFQNNLERAEFETRVKFTQRVEALERDNAVLRRRADGTDEQQKAFVVTLEVTRAGEKGPLKSRNQHVPCY